ncbi:HNH endonuclease signature motif containing protein [Streptomyces sp. NPDC057235]|uniref:HNH endonuclease signature motif containing protein n=1 Tax=Streptomyces sp. NPDC057235 TaxID=3346058 RepID=UPI00363D5979
MPATTPITLSTFLSERDISRFWFRVTLPDAEGHLLWTGHRNEHGYGQIRIWHRAWYTHRVSFVIANGEIPDGLVIDHTCRTPACVAPLHLELVTQAENMRRARRTHCKRGHALEGSNVYIRPDNGTRQCRACAALRRQGGKAA